MLRRQWTVGMIALLAAACAELNPEPVAALRGGLELSVEPNPIVATPLGDDLYELKFDIVMREAGGVALRIEDFTVDAVAYGTVTVRSQTYPASFITDRGYPASIGAGKYLRFSFTKRWTLPTPLLLSGASARVTARTIDEKRGERGVGGAGGGGGAESVGVRHPSTIVAFTTETQRRTEALCRMRDSPGSEGMISSEPGERWLSRYCLCVALCSVSLW